MSSSTTTAAARKQQRQARFFKAISSSQTQSGAQYSKSKSNKENDQKQQDSTSNASSTTSASASKPAPLSAADVQKLLDAQANPVGQANIQTVDQASPEERKAMVAGMEKFAGLPDSELPPDRRAARAKMWEMQKSIQALLAAPTSSLTPELQQIQCRYAAVKAQFDAADETIDVRRRINDLLRANAEEDIPFAEYAAQGHILQSQAKFDEKQEQLQDRMSDLQARKPKVYAKLMVLFQEYVNIKATAQSKVDLKFR